MRLSGSSYGTEPGFLGSQMLPGGSGALQEVMLLLSASPPIFYVQTEKLEIVDYI